ncbi:hypothetical protein CSA57_07625 [candidate division KSB3 bacterium]|nr:MAG: hypothetical protein CSA57_07625 [candidate division KSB3 bacterium]
MPDDVMTFRAALPATRTHMPTALKAAKQMLRAKMPAAKMTVRSTIPAGPLTALGAAFNSAVSAKQFSAAMTFAKTVAAHRLSAAIADPDVPHLLCAYSTEREAECSGKKIVKTFNNDLRSFRECGEDITTSSHRDLHRTETDRFD